MLNTELIFNCLLTSLTLLLGSFDGRKGSVPVKCLSFSSRTSRTRAGRKRAVLCGRQHYVLCLSIYLYVCVCVFLHFLISLLSTSGCFVFVAHYSAFSALTLSVGRQEGHLACKN